MTERIINFVHDLLARANIGLVWYGLPQRAQLLRAVRDLRRKREMLLNPVEAYQIAVTVKSTGKIPGDIAEVGVFRGASAKLICEARSGNKDVHLFDTFEGLPAPGEQDQQFREGQFASSLADVRDFLKGYPRVHLYKGLFPETAGPVRDRSFSFVHLDVDLYQSTLDALQFFYPRMTRGGIILGHDYILKAGPTKAFVEFFSDRPEPIVELAAHQCLIVKTEQACNTN